MDAKEQKLIDAQFEADSKLAAANLKWVEAHHKLVEANSKWAEAGSKLALAYRKWLKAYHKLWKYRVSKAQ